MENSLELRFEVWLWGRRLRRLAQKISARDRYFGSEMMYEMIDAFYGGPNEFE